MLVYPGFGGLGGDGLNATDARRRGTFEGDFKQPDVSGGGHVGASAQLHRVGRVKNNHAHSVAVLFSEQGHCSHGFGLVDGHAASFFEDNVLPDLVVDQSLYLLDFFIAKLGEVREIEAQQLIVNQRAALLHVVAEHLTQGGVEQVRGGVVVLRAPSLVGVHHAAEGLGRILRQLLGDVHNQVIVFLGINYANAFALALQVARVAHLPAALGVEGSGIQHHLIVRPVFLAHFAVLHNPCLGGEVVVAHEGDGRVVYHRPVAGVGYRRGA